MLLLLTIAMGDKGPVNFNCLVAKNHNAGFVTIAGSGGTTYLEAFQLHVSCISWPFFAFAVSESSHADVAPVAVDHAQVYTPFMERVRSLTDN